MKEYMRLESDSIGTMEVPEDAYYGVQALRAKENFPITGTRLHPVFIKNLAKIKRAAAITNRKAGRLKPEIANAIESACNEVVCGMFDKEFIVDGIQGGAGTSANMNMNEVIANRAIEMLCGKKGDYTIVHPNDHVNMAQSTNDVIPTAGKLTVLDLLKPLDKSLSLLTDALYDKAAAFDHIVKIGRTQLEDAVPMRLGQTFHSYATMISLMSLKVQVVNDNLIWIIAKVNVFHLNLARYIRQFGCTRKVCSFRFLVDNSEHTFCCGACRLKLTDNVCHLIDWSGELTGIEHKRGKISQRDAASQEKQRTKHADKSQ